MYPALQDLGTNTLHPIGAEASFLVGRNPAANIPITDTGCSRAQFRIVRTTNGFVVEGLSTTVPTLCDGRPLNGPALLRDGTLIQAGAVRFRFLLAPPSAAQPAAPVSAAPVPPPHPVQHILNVDSGHETILSGTDGADAEIGATSPIPVVGTIYFGRDPAATVPLPHPQVSRRHAVVIGVPGGATIRDLGSANGTFVNGRRLERGQIAQLKAGDGIDIGPYALKYDGRQFTSRSRSNNVELVAWNVRRTVTDAQTGQPLTLLDDITLVIRPKEFVCLLGPSGSGKSTLMSILSGRGHPDEGVVLLNGQDLHARFGALKQDIALVPQSDLLHNTLTVGQGLWYTARLRLPSDTSSSETDACISETLNTVQLVARRGTKVRNLSGGQVKRASLANEILCKPSLLFLDEVTSGLDERTDRDMMHLFRSLADGGKTVVCVTHSLTNVEATCTHVVILTPGGKLAFIGPPADAIRYFDIARLGDVYTKLEQRPAEEWQAAFRASPYYAKYVTDRLPAGKQPPPPISSNKSAKQQIRVFLRQTSLLASRYLAVWRGAPSALLAMAGQPLLVALLLILVFGDVTRFENAALKTARTESLLFLLAVTAFWLGCNNAAKELVKERGIFTRERDYNLLASSYQVSKLIVLVVFALIQVSLLYGVVKWACDPPGNFIAQFVVLFGLAVAGTTLGLLLSALSTSEDVAVSLIPVAVIPQVILAGGIAPLSGVAQWLARVMVTTYWGKRGLDSTLPEDLAASARAAELAEEAALATALVMIAVHTIVFTIATLAVLIAQGRAAVRLMTQLRKAIR